ncbi:MAG TPA: addiction module protein [Segetibacter sp.]|nr:addiction module protein [Segetibacter sp.]
MSIDIQKLLLLSSEEKRIIAETLWDSLLSEDENEGLAAEERQLLQQRWDSLKNGESKLHDWEDVKSRIRQQV